MSGRDFVYIAGPMRGYPGHNFVAFREAAERFRRAGFNVVSPVEIGGVLFGNDPGIAGGEYLRADLLAIVQYCSAIALLPGWQASTGARCEVAVGITIGLDFCDALSGERIPAPALVRICGGYERAPGVVESLDELAAEARRWQVKQFPHRTVGSIAEHLRREAMELHAAPTDAGEMADVFLLLAGLAAEVGIDLGAAVRAKLDKCKARKWGEPDAQGVVEHIAEPAGGAR